MEGVEAEEEASVRVEGAVEAAAGGGDGWDASSSAVSKGVKLPGNLKTGSVITGELPVIILPGNYRVT